MKLLLHTCCAPCSVYCIDSLREEGIEPDVYWYNPNIHPYMEYKARRDCLKEYTKQIQVKAIFEEDYGLVPFCQKVSKHLEARCQMYCYPVRLEQTAKYAKEHGYDAFSTTLLVSPYQKHDIIREIGERVAEKYGLTFLYRDFRVGFRQGQAKARSWGLYMQKYCGCIFSEASSNSHHITSDSTVATFHNKITERKIRLGWEVPNLELREYKNGNQDEIQFIYNLKKEVYQKYVENISGEWNEENQKKLFHKFMKENSKNIELILIGNKIVGFFNGKDKDDKTFEIGNICLKPEYQNKGIGTAVLKEILFEHKEQEIILQCFKENRAINLYQKLGFKRIEENDTHIKMKK